MDRLWAPWRINYISAAKRAKGCLFCRISKQARTADRKNLIVRRSEHVFCVLNKFPYNNGHLMFAPYRHIRSLSQLNNGEILDLFSTLNKIQALLREVLKPDGFNLGMNLGGASGAGIPGHLHLHVVPRWREDTNFMPALFDTKVVPQSLESLYEKLHKRI